MRRTRASRLLRELERRVVAVRKGFPGHWTRRPHIGDSGHGFLETSFKNDDANRIVGGRLAYNLLNVVLDPILIFGARPAPLSLSLSLGGGGGGGGELDSFVPLRAFGARSIRTLESVSPRAFRQSVGPFKGDSSSRPSCLLYAFQTPEFERAGCHLGVAGAASAVRVFFFFFSFFSSFSWRVLLEIDALLLLFLLPCVWLLSFFRSRPTRRPQHTTGSGDGGRGRRPTRGHDFRNST